MSNVLGSGKHRTPIGTGQRRALLAAAVAVVAGGGIAITSVALAGTTQIRPATGHDKALQAALDSVVKDGLVPGALMSVRDSKGTVTDYTAGVGDIVKKSKVPTDGYVRTVSNTKMYTAVAILQLVGEGKIALTDTVEKHLPGVVRGTGKGAAIDGRKITIEQLLQHTSGLTDQTFLDSPAGIRAVKDRFFEPRELLDSAFAQPPTFADGQPPIWRYSNAGYVTLGLVAQKVTGRPFAEVVTDRVIRRAGLTETYYPGPGERGIRSPHPQGYMFDPNITAQPTTEDLVDITRFDPSIAGAAGQMISTPSDLNKFLVALQGGRLLQPRELAKMRQTKTVEAPGWPEGWRYGLGTIEFPLTCGKIAYGHGGDADGFQSRAAITADGRAVTIVGTNDEDKIMDFVGVFDKALCAKN